MSPERHEIWKVADSLQMDLRAAQGKLTELRRMIAALDLPDPSRVTCPHCGLEARGPNTLAEHVYVSHDGPVPASYQHAESISI